jgi:FlaA1/EpsC-like NDP-sugar epimerase
MMHLHDKFHGGYMLFSNADFDLSPNASGVSNAEAEVVLSRVPNPALAWLQKAGDGHIRGAQSTVDGAIIVLSFLTSFQLRYDGNIAGSHALQFVLWIPVLVFGRIVLLRKLGIHRFMWRFVCLSDAVAIARSLLVMTGALLLLRWLYPGSAPLAYWLRLPIGIIVPEYLLSLGGLLTIRGICRMAQERSDRSAKDEGWRRRRVVLYGAGRAGVLLARELASHSGFEIVGFVDDDPHKADSVIAGIRVLGSGYELESLVRRRQVDEVMISIAAARSAELTCIISRCKTIHVDTRIVPSVEEIIAGHVNISHVREIRVEDLLGRSTVVAGEFGPHARDVYQNKQVLITGAGGSIGSELCRQLLLLKPAKLAILDKDENSIFELEHELKLRAPEVPIEPLIADIKLRDRIADVFGEFRPQVVLQAAAHKHVPLMERHPCEAVLNNVMGLRNVIEVCRALSVERFVFISSDKAVNPTNVMGATKRIGEKLLMTCAGGSIRSASVRFGNVMGSRGSVIPLFQRQIEAGGPVTVTHPDIVRYFMTIREAVQLVLCAGSLAGRAETFVLDMGDPRRVIDLARQMIELAGLEPDKDIQIAITGLRPGEKMEEELIGPAETLQSTRFDKVFEIPHAPFDEQAFRSDVEDLILIAQRGDRETLCRQLTTMGLGYHHPSLHGHLTPDRILTCAS